MFHRRYAEFVPHCKNYSDNFQMLWGTAWVKCTAVFELVMETSHKFRLGKKPICPFTLMWQKMQNTKNAFPLWKICCFGDHSSRNEKLLQLQRLIEQTLFITSAFGKCLVVLRQNLQMTYWARKKKAAFVLGKWLLWSRSIACGIPYHKVFNDPSLNLAVASSGRRADGGRWRTSCEIRHPHQLLICNDKNWIVVPCIGNRSKPS